MDKSIRAKNKRQTRKKKNKREKIIQINYKRGENFYSK